MSPEGRPTADLVLLVVVGTLAAVTLLIGAGIFAVLVWAPTREIDAIVTAYGNYLGTLVGAFLGYTAGRSRRSRSE